jgi:hypothetical protein
MIDRENGVHHSNSLMHITQLSLTSVKGEPNHIPSTLREQVVLTIDMDHTILQDALPLVFHSGDLHARRCQSGIRKVSRSYGRTLSYVQKTMSLSVNPPSSCSSSPSVSESSRSLLMASGSSVDAEVVAWEELAWACLDTDD